MVSVMLKTWAGWAKLWLVNLNSSLKLVNLWLVETGMCDYAINYLAYELT